MSKTIRITAKRVFSALLSLSIGVAGLCLIGGCLFLYFGEGAYSRELVAATFSGIAVPVWIAVGMIAVGALWELISPSDAEHCKVPKAYGVMLTRLHQTRDAQAHAAAVRTEQRRRKVISLVRLCLTLAGLLVFFAYAVRPANYSDDINASVVRAMWVAIPCFAVPFVCSVIAAKQTDKSYQREIAILKECPAKTDFIKKDAPAAKERRGWLTAFRAVLLVIAVAALIYGFVAGGTMDVLTKAINICTECIGLG